MPMPNPSHILVPTVIEEGGRGDRAFDIYSQLLRERIVFLGQEVDDQVANLIISQILFWRPGTPRRTSTSTSTLPAAAYAGMAIYDVMQHVAPDVSTICVGMGMSAAAMILCGGAAGKRFSLPNARIMIHQGSAGTRGAPSDMEIQFARFWPSPTGCPRSSPITAVDPWRRWRSTSTRPLPDRGGGA